MLPLLQVPLEISQKSYLHGLTLIVVYPEHLVVYHAGTARTVFIGCMKVNTIFLFSFSCLVIAPSFYISPERPNWTVPAGKSVMAAVRSGD